MSSLYDFPAANYVVNCFDFCISISIISSKPTEYNLDDKLKTRIFYSYFIHMIQNNYYLFYHLWRQFLEAHGFHSSLG